MPASNAIGHGRRFAKWMLRNTKICTDHLTPEISLRLITEQCPLWMSTPDQCPFPDPYWAFYWPGGQAISRFILGNADWFAGRNILDFGCGCGAGCVAALKVGVRSVLANDIDCNALAATYLNCRTNNLTPKSIQDRVHFVADDLTSQANLGVDCVLVGDMFYDSEFGDKLLAWLQQIKTQNPKIRVLIGDPGRHALNLNHVTVRSLAKYALPAYVIKQHYGFNSVQVLELLESRL